MADRTPTTRRAWAELIADQFETDAVDAIEEGIARGGLLTASAIEARRAATTGAVHESAVPKGDAQ